MCSGMQSNVCDVKCSHFYNLCTILGVFAIVNHNCCICLSTWNNLTPTSWIFTKFIVRNFLIKYYLFISLSMNFFFFWQSTRNEQPPVRAKYHPYRCDLCSISFKNQLLLKRHQDIHHAQRPFVCKGCRKIFIRKGILHLHLRLRSEDRPSYCAACSRKFSRANGVKTRIPAPSSEQS